MHQKLSNCHQCEQLDCYYHFKKALQHDAFIEFFYLPSFFDLVTTCVLGNLSAFTLDDHHDELFLSLKYRSGCSL
jgi:hypothetical protein